MSQHDSDTAKPTLHFVAPPDAHGQRVALTALDGNGCRDSGDWNVVNETADQPVELEAKIHLQESQKQPSWLAGRIVAWHPVINEQGKPRAVFTFVPDDEVRRVQTEGCGQERAYVGLGKRTQ